MEDGILRPDGTEATTCDFDPDGEHHCDPPTHWCEEWDAALCDQCCEEQNTREEDAGVATRMAVAIPCQYLIDRYESMRMEAEQVLYEAEHDL